MGWFSRAGGRASSRKDAFAPAPSGPADDSWLPPGGELLAVTRSDVVEMTDAQQVRFKQLIDAEVEQLDQLQSDLRKDRSSWSLQMQTRAARMSTALHGQTQLLQFDQAHRSGQFIDKLGEHPHAW